MQLMTAQALHKRCKAVWNRFGKVPVCKWLQDRASSGDVERLKAVGNIVFPRVAQLALHVLSHRLES